MSPRAQTQGHGGGVDDHGVAHRQFSHDGGQGVGGLTVDGDSLQAGTFGEDLLHPARSELHDRPALEALDELVDPLVVGPERVLAQNGSLGLVVQLQMDPVHRVVPLAFLGLADELTA